MYAAKQRVLGALLGLACGDAVGTTLEFKRRGTFEPIRDMVGGGPFNLDAGQWTDDMSMALCLAHSLLQKQGFDAVDQINRYCDWQENGYMSSTGKCFDIGNTVRAALNKYRKTKDPFAGASHDESSGNGAIMRLAPIPMAYHNDIDTCIEFAGTSSRTTHGSEKCIESARLFASLIFMAFSANTKEDVFKANTYRSDCATVQAIADREFLTKTYDELTGSGYVIESLESALWCFMNSTSFEESILLSANIGNDADTTAAICGQIAGAFYGVGGIPQKWLEKLTMKDEIIEVGNGLFEFGGKSA
jgi:ADP-ribosyl-[dinitrogen reductase] hydrolase